MAQPRTPEDAHDFPCIRDLLSARAAQAPNAAAVLAPGRPPLTFGRLAEEVDRVVGRLNALGLGRGDRVAIVLPNGPQMALAFFCVACGATCAPLNPAYREPEFDFYLSDLGAKAIIMPAGAGSPARAVAAARSIPVLELSEAPGGEAGTFTLEGPAAAGATSGGFAGAEDVALVLHTSGTTSRPKIVPLTHANLCASAGNVRRSLALGPADRCLNVMPLFHIHGLVAAVLSSLGAGGSVLCTPGFDASQFCDWLDEFRPTWYTAVPTMHQAILARAEREGLPLRRPSLRFVRSCSSALPPQLMAALEEAFGVPVVEAYGMTEAAHQMACNPLPPGERKPGSVGLPTGVEISIRNEAGDVLPTGERGEVCIRGPNVTHGYEANPEANRKSFTDGWFRTGDEGCLDDDGYLRLTDRIKEIINRGGEKVSPREVDEVLMDHPTVAQALTFAVPHPELGEDVVAAIVPREGKVPDNLALRQFAAARLAEFKVPRQVIIVGEIPKGPTGKLQRIGMHERLGHLLHVEYVAPRDEVEEALAGIWADLLHLARVGLDDNFFLSGGSSLSAVQMLTRVRGMFDVDVPLDQFFRRATLADLADAVRNAAPGAGEVWQTGTSAVVAVQPGGTRPPFFMAEYGLGWEVRDLARHLGPDQPVYGLRALPLLDGSTRRPRAREVAEFFIEELRRVRPHGPYVLGGGCSAGLVAFEMAQRLTQQGESVPLVALFDVDYPPAGVLPTLLGAALLRVPRELSRWRRLRGEERRAMLRESARRWTARLLGRSPANDASADAAVRLRRQLVDLRDACWRYAPRPYAGRLALFLPADTSVWPHRDRRLDWRRLALGGCEVRVVPGEHDAALLEPHAAATAVALRDCIDRALAAQDAG